MKRGIFVFENLKRVIVETIKENVKGYILIIGVFFAGIALSYILNISSSTEEEIRLYLSDFITTVKDYTIDSTKTFNIAIGSYLKLYLFLFLMAVSSIGTVGVLCFIFVKGFSYGVVISSAFAAMGGKAMLLFFCVIFPHILILFPFIITYSLFCLKNSYGILKGFKNMRNNVFLPFIYACICIAFSGIAALIQAYLEPILIRLIY